MHQKEEIEAQRDEIEAQRDELENQNARIALQNKEITASIVYAKRIQIAVMPTESEILQIMPDGFIYFKPRDIVSGDFYWASQRKDKIVIVAAELHWAWSSGSLYEHAGAISFLNEIINEQELPTANEILNQASAKMYSNTLSQQGGKYLICRMVWTLPLGHILIKKKCQQNLPALFNPMVLIRNGELHEVPETVCDLEAMSFERESFKNNVDKDI